MRKLVSSVLLWSLLSLPALAEQNNSGALSGNRFDADHPYPYSLAGRISTLGLGVELSRTLTDTTAVRLGLNGGDYSFDETASDIAYEMELDWSSVSMMFDWHPGASAFRLSAGLLSNGNEINAFGQGVGTYQIGDMSFDAADVGSLNGKVGFDSVATMVSLGWDNVFSDNRFGVSLGLGVVFQGSPEVSLVADGLLAADPVFQAELARELAEFQDDADDYKLYPVASMGLSFRF